MNNNVVFTNASRFVLLCLFQVWILRSISVAFPNFPYLNIFVYPLFILLLPFKINQTLVIFLGFALGLTIDLFYDTLGLHASVCTFLAFIRPLPLRWLEPKGGYLVSDSPTPKKMGMGWFLRYSAILMAVHIVAYFSVEAFTPYYFVSILLKSLVSFGLSMIFMIFVMTIVNPSN